MKKLINKLNDLGTKRLTLLFVSLSFIGILLCSFYNHFEKNNIIQNEIVEIKDSNALKEDQLIPNEIQKSNQVEKKKENNSSKKKIKNDSKDKNIKEEKSTSKKRTEKENNKQVVDKDEKINVHLKITGLKQEIIFSKNIKVDKDSTVYNVLKNVKELKITSNGFGSMIYIQGINDLYEKQHGKLSGWMYSVNGKEPNVGAGSYKVKNNDIISWYYVNVEDE